MNTLWNNNLLKQFIIYNIIFSCIFVINKIAIGQILPSHSSLARMSYLSEISCSRNKTRICKIGQISSLGHLYVMCFQCDS